MTEDRRTSLEIVSASQVPKNENNAFSVKPRPNEGVFINEHSVWTDMGGCVTIVIRGSRDAR